MMPRGVPARPRPTGLLRFGWVPRLVLLASFAFGMLASVRVARAEGETESQEQRAPAEEEVEEAKASAVRAGSRRFARGGAVERAFGVLLAPRSIAAPDGPARVRPQVRLPRRTGPPDEEDDDCA